MKNIFTLIIFTTFFVSCTKIKDKDVSKDLFEPSYKETKDENEFTEYFDSTSYIYSNYKYHIAVKAPKTWQFDQGVTEHMIFRSFDRDSGYSFNVNVIETKYNIEEIFWPEYEKNKTTLDKQLKDVLDQQLNTKTKVELSTTSYIRNYKSLKKKYSYTVRDQDYEIDMLYLSQQVPKGNFTYTIALVIPKQFYAERPQYFESFFSNIYWLSDKERINEAIQKSNDQSK